MKRVLLSGVLLMMGVISFAQKDPKAKALLDAVSNKFKTYKSVTASFAYQIQNKAGKVLANKSGVVSMKGQKYNVNLGANKIICDGTTIWNYDPAAKEVTVNKANTGNSTITPQKLFTNFYDRDFNYKLGGTKTVAGKKTEEVVLTPTDSKKPFSAVYLYINQATNSIVSANVVEKAGNKYTYTISSMKPNATVSDANFTFNKASYPGVEVVDLR